jgi:SAM-dependent methyltransferase
MVSMSLKELARRIVGTNCVGGFLRLRTIQRRLPQWLPSPCERVFDAGCGSGINLQQLGDLFPAASVSGVDIEEDMVRRAQSRLPGGKFWVADLTKMEAEPVHDLVLNVDVLEHIEDYEAALRTMAGMLKPGGILVLHTPHEVQRRLLPFRVLQDHEQHDHVREGFGEKALAEDFRRAGLEVVHQERTVGTLGAILWEVDFLLRQLRPLNFVFLPLWKALAWLDIGSNHPQGNGILIIGRKPPQGQ